MLKFHEENHDIFDFFLKVEKENDLYNIKVLFPENQEIPDYIKGIGRFCFPYDQCITDNEYKFYFGLTDASKNQTYAYVNTKKTIAYCLITPFFHPKLFQDMPYILSDMNESNISRTCAKFHLELKIYHEKMDWRASFNEIQANKNDRGCSNISPSCELSKLYEFIFCKLPIQYILIILVAMTLDCRIIVTSSDLSNISVAIFSLLALIYPVKWPGTFIPILPSSILTMLDAPFAYLIGIHSSAADAMISIDRYFVINIDFHYCASVGMEDFPPEVLKFIDERSDSIKKLINRYSPYFPFIQIQKQIRMFIRDLFGVAYGIENTDDYQQIVSNFNQWKSVPSEEFKAIFSQTQFINGFINEIIYEHNQEIFQAFWPNHVFIQAEPPTNDDTKEIPKHCGLKRCRNKSIGKEDLEKLLYSSNQSFFDNDDDNSNNDNIISSNDEINKVEADDNKNINTIPDHKAENDEKRSNEGETDPSKDNNQQNKSKPKKKNKVNSVQLSPLNLKKFDLNNNDNELYEDTNHTNSSRKVKKRRSSKHRSQSVENRLLYKNNPYSIMNNKSANEEPPKSTNKPIIPQYYDKDFIDASDDENLTPTPRKAHPQLPIPKRPPSKVPEIPLSNNNENDHQIKQHFNRAKLLTSENNGNQKSQAFIRKVNTFNYENSPNGGILLSPSRAPRNSSEKSTPQGEIKRVGIAKRSSSTALHSARENSTEEHTRKRKKKRRTQSNLTEKDKNLHLPTGKQDTSSNENNEIKTEKSNENKISLNETKDIDQITSIPTNDTNEFSTPIDNKTENRQTDEKINRPNINSKTPTKNTNIEDDSDDDDNEANKNPSKHPITPINKPINRRPLPGSSDARNKISSLNLNKVNNNNNIRPFRQLTPRNHPVLRNSAFIPGVKTTRNLSPSQRLSNGPYQMARNRPKLNLNFSDNSSDYEYNYSDSNNEQTAKENVKKAPVLSARADINNIQRNNILLHHFQRKRKTSLENTKTNSMRAPQTRTNGNTSDGNGEFKRNSDMMTRPRIAPNIRRNIPSKPFNNTQRAPPLIKFSSSSDYEYN